MASIDELVAFLEPVAVNVISGAFKVSGAGALGKIRETNAVIDYLGRAGKKFENSLLIQKLLLEIDGEDLRGIDLDVVAVEDTLNNMAGADEYLTSLGEDGQNIKELLYGLAESIIAAAGTGLLGGGEKVTDTEAQYLTRLKMILGY